MTRSLPPGELAEPEKSPEKLEGVLQSAFELLAGVITASALHAEDVDRALKSAGLDRDIDKQLHARSTTGSA